MKPHSNGKLSNLETSGNTKQNQSASNLESLYNSMSIEEIKKSKPKSRLESFLRRKALKNKNMAFS